VRKHRCIQSFVGDPRKKNFFENLGLDRRITLGWIFNHLAGWSMDWIDVVQEKDRLQALVNVVMKLRIP
jgi:hypothetical protein